VTAAGEFPAAARRAAVVIPLIAGEEPGVLFVRRAAHLRRNAGQIGFPGGLVDDDDAGDLLRTALREFEEELGVGRDAVDVVHRLADALVINRTVIVTPFVGVLRGRPELRVDRREVDAALVIPLARIVAPGALHEGVEAFAGLRIPTWQFDDGATHVWGATARMLRTLLEAVRDEPALRAALAERAIVWPSGRTP